MIAHTTSAASLGFEGKIIDIECDTSNGLPSLIIVGLGNKSIDEAKERIRSAIKNSGLDFPRKRMTLNLAPADLPKDGTSYDLPMALAILVCSNQLPAASIASTLIAGELSLDGSLRPIRGTINHMEVARLHNLKRIIIPPQNIAQAQLVKGVEILAPRTLKELVQALRTADMQPLQKSSPPLVASPPRESILLEDIHGQQQAKRALIIAAAGRHNILMDGSPGAGKTMLAKALRGILSSPSGQEQVDITKLFDLAGEPYEASAQRPFRSPHHTASRTALTGGGNPIRPGEISLAHRGVLFLDELPEFPRSVLETLRQPLEDKTISISRAQQRFTFPADFMLIATRNPCPCGFAYDPKKECTCTAQQMAHYQKKVSGPLLDRIDMIITVNPVAPSDLLSQSASITSQMARALIAQADQRQQQRFQSTEVKNAHLTPAQIKQLARLEPPAKTLLDRAAEKMGFSARVYIKMIRLARTIADLYSSDTITADHIREALQYRSR